MYKGDGMREEFFCLSSTDELRKRLISRINRIAGQLRGIEKMILNHIKCDEILNQIASVKSALNGVAKVVLEAHLKNCVVQEIKSGLEQEATSELILTLNSLIEKRGLKTDESNDDIIRKIEKQIEEMRKSIEKETCCSSVLKDISTIKGELDSMARAILEGHIKNCLVREVKGNNEEKTIDDFLYTINKMIK